MCGKRTNTSRDWLRSRAACSGSSATRTVIGAVDCGTEFMPAEEGITSANTVPCFTCRPGQSWARATLSVPLLAARNLS